MTTTEKRLKATRKAIILKVPEEIKTARQELSSVVWDARKCWGEYDKRPSLRVVKAAEELLEKIAGEHLQKPQEIYSGRDGEIAFVWRRAEPGCEGYKQLESWLMPDGLVRNSLWRDGQSYQTTSQSELFNALARF